MSALTFREQAAIAAMAAILTKLPLRAWPESQGEELTKDRYVSVAAGARRYADALAAELEMFPTEGDA